MEYTQIVCCSPFFFPRLACFWRARRSLQTRAVTELRAAAREALARSLASTARSFSDRRGDTASASAISGAAARIADAGRFQLTPDDARELADLYRNFRRELLFLFATLPQDAQKRYSGYADALLAYEKDLTRDCKGGAAGGCLKEDDEPAPPAKGSPKAGQAPRDLAKALEAADARGDLESAAAPEAIFAGRLGGCVSALVRIQTAQLVHTLECVVSASPSAPAESRSSASFAATYAHSRWAARLGHAGRCRRAPGGSTRLMVKNSEMSDLGTA